MVADANLSNVGRAVIFSPDTIALPTAPSALLEKSHDRLNFLNIRFLRFSHTR
jgi:hypothetical protein